MKRLLLLTPLLMATTCGTLPAEWFQTGAIKKPYDAVFDATRELLEKEHHFKIEKADKADRIIHTDWKVQLSPHWREGKRDKVEVEFDELPGGAINVRIRTHREFNDNARNPSSAQDADWQSEGGNDPYSERIGWQLRLRLKGLGLEDEK